MTQETQSTYAQLATVSKIVEAPIHTFIPEYLRIDFENKPTNEKESVDYIARLFSAIQGHAEDIKNEEKALSAKRRQYESTLELFQNLFKEELKDLGLAELKGNNFQFSLYESGNPALIIEDEKILPEKYKKQIISIEIDKNLLKADLLYGLEIAGAKIKRSMVLTKRALNDEQNKTFHNKIIE